MLCDTRIRLQIGYKVDKCITVIIKSVQTWYWQEFRTLALNADCGAERNANVRLGRQRSHAEFFAGPFCVPGLVSGLGIRGEK